MTAECSGTLRVDLGECNGRPTVRSQPPRNRTDGGPGAGERLAGSGAFRQPRCALRTSLLTSSTHMRVPGRAVRILLFLLALDAFSSSTPALAGQPNSGPELLGFIQEAHRSSRESIRTLACRVEFKATIGSQTPPKLQSCSGQYWYSPDAVRAQVAEFDKQYDSVWKNSVRTSLVRTLEGGKEVVGASRAAFANRHLGRCDAWVRALFMLNIPGEIEYIPFEELAKKSKRLSSAKLKTIDHRELASITLEFDAREDSPATWVVEVQFDPQVNYLVRRVSYTATFKGGKLYREDEVVEFKEFDPGIFFPVSARGRSGPDGKTWDFNYTTTFSDVQVNQRLPDSIFHLRFPAGVTLADSIRRSSYRVDAEGNRISPETPDRGSGIIPPPVGNLDVEGGMESQEEPRALSKLILPVSLCLAVLGMVGLVVRRLRQLRSAG